MTKGDNRDMEIRCRKCDCAHNTGSSCRARTVHIHEHTAECDTYAPDCAKHAVTVQKGTLFRAAKSLPPKNTRNVPLACAAHECLFNKRENCIANGICVVDDAALATTGTGCGASCATFIGG